MSSDQNKQYKKTKQKCPRETNPECIVISRSTGPHRDNKAVEHIVPLLAKDSEWVDILESNQTDGACSSANVSEEEEVLQLVECEDGSRMKPLAILFPGLLEQDPETLRGMLSKTMSTTEVTRHLVRLGQKANFTFMKKTDRLIPPEKKWLESLVENSNSYCCTSSGSHIESLSSTFESENSTYDVTKNICSLTVDGETKQVLKNQKEPVEKQDDEVYTKVGD